MFFMQTQRLLGYLSQWYVHRVNLPPDANDQYYPLQALSQLVRELGKFHDSHLRG